MSSISKATEEIINRSPFLREAMTENLINISALARKIKGEIERYVGKEVKEGAMQVEEIDDVDLQLVWDPPWTKDMMSDAAKLELNL